MGAVDDSGGKSRDCSHLRSVLQLQAHAGQDRGRQPEEGEPLGRVRLQARLHVRLGGCHDSRRGRSCSG